MADRRGKWKGSVYILDGSVVGTIQKTPGGNWHAFGCMDEWEDTPLGVRYTEAHAKEEVMLWVSEHADKA